MSSRYTVSALTTVTAATADLAIAVLWNPSSSKSIFVTEWHVGKTAAGGADRPKLRRTSTRGTAGSTVTPAAVHQHAGGLVAPASGALLDLNVFSAEPTKTAGDLHQSVISAGVGAGLMWVFADEPIEVPAGKGLALCTGSAIAFPASTVTVGWVD